MRQELEKALETRFPFLVIERLIDCHCAHSDGWYGIVEHFLEEYAKLPIPDGVCITQIKEEMGELRIFIGYPRQGRPLPADVPAAERLAMAAREQSRHVCEICGQPGKWCNWLIWVRTLCRECSETNPRAE